MADFETVHDALDHTGLTGVSGASDLLQVKTAISTVRDTITSTSLTDTSLSLAFTPVADDSTLLIEVDGTVFYSRSSGTIQHRYSWVAIYNSTNSVLLAEQDRGRELVAASSVGAQSLSPIALRALYTVNSTAARTFKFQVKVAESGGQVLVLGDRTGGIIMTIWELAA